METEKQNTRMNKHMNEYSLNEPLSLKFSDVSRITTP